jgi:hypothetical protein
MLKLLKNCNKNNKRISRDIFSRSQNKKHSQKKSTKKNLKSKGRVRTYLHIETQMAIGEEIKPPCNPFLDLTP